MRTLAFKPSPPSVRDERYKSGRWKRTRKAVLKRDGYQCQIRLVGCLGIANSADHIIPSEVTGYDDPLFWDMGNLQAACMPCNRRKWSGVPDSKPRPGTLIQDFSRSRP